jgi:prevent-host-death family protein
MNTTAVPAKIMAAEEVRRDLRHVFDEVVAGQDIVVERYSKRVIAMIRYEDYEALLEELEDLRDARRADEIREAIRSGKMKTVPWEQLKEELRAKGLLDD